MTATAHRLVSCSAGCPGNNEAVCPSSPIPSSVTSKSGRSGSKRGRRRRSALASSRMRRRLAPATSPRSAPHEYCRRERELAKGMRRAPCENCCRDGRAARTVRRPRTSAHGSMESATQLPAPQDAHRDAAASSRPTGIPQRRARFACARPQSHSATSCASVSALSKVRLSVDAATVIVRQPSCSYALFRMSCDGGRVIAGTEYRRSGDDRVGACGDGQCGIFAVLPAVHLDPRIESL